MKRRDAFKISIFLVTLLAPLALPLAAQTPAEQKKIVDGIRIEQNLGAAIDLDLEFYDEDGRTVRLGQYFKDKPVLITPVYFECPMLCNLILQELVKTLKVLAFTPGQDFEIITYSISPSEKPALAKAKKKNILKAYGRENAGEGWHFLTSGQESITALSNTLGFYYTYDEKTELYAHAAALMISNPKGMISRYFTGIMFSPKDIRLSLVAASGGKIGSPIDQILLLCYHYDPETGKYGLAITRLLRVAGTVTVLMIFSAIWFFLKKEKKSKQDTAS